MAVPTLRDLRVAVIGGSTGIGFSVAEAALAEGAQVVIGSSRADKVADAVSRLGSGASGQVIDVKDEASIKAFFETVGAFDHLAYTAGDWDTAARRVSMADFDPAIAAGGLNVRFWGALLAIKHGQPRMRPNGSITLTDGVRTHRPSKGMPLSSAFGGAIEHLAKGLAVDLAPLRVNAVCPGIVLTDIWANVSPEALAKMTAGLPVPRGGDPAEVAQAYVYLMKAAYTTGQVLVVDGGLMLV